MENKLLDWHHFIHSDPKILLGKPVIKGTRISVELILELFSCGWETQQILDSYPSLKEDDIKAVFNYLTELIQHELYFPVKQGISL